MSQLREECGDFGIFSPAATDVAMDAYYGLFALQHRGQESCGIVVNDDGIFRDYKDHRCGYPRISPRRAGGGDRAGQPLRRILHRLL